MKPAYQRIVCPERGDCQSAALASVLELPTEAVPPFVVVHDPRPDNEPYPADVAPHHVSFLVPLAPRVQAAA